MKGKKIMLEIMEKNNKNEITTIDMADNLKNATTKINEFHRIAKNAILGISLILSEIAEKPKEYLEGSGFNTIAEYAESMFSYKKAYTYKLIKISKFISIKDINGEKIDIADLVNNKIENEYYFDVLKDTDGFEFNPSQMLELIPLTEIQLEDNLNSLDSALTCKELRAIVKNIVNPPVETTATDSDFIEEEKDPFSDFIESEEESALTDKDRILKMLEICSSMENEEVKGKIINVFQKSLKVLEK